MYKYILLTFILLFNINYILSIIPNETKFIKISFKDKFLIPIIYTLINNKKIETILDNNINFNYLSTKNFNLTDINFNHNTDKINIKDKNYKAYFYIGNISIYDNYNYIQLNNFNSFVIDDKSLFSSITVYYLLQQFNEKLLIDKKIFYLDMINKQFIFGELTIDSNEYKQKKFYDKFTHSIFYSNNTNGVFKEKLNSLFIDNNYIQIAKNISFNINEKYSFIPHLIMEEIIKDNKISDLNCSLFFIENEGTTIKCHKKDINKLPDFYFVFNNYTIKIPFKLLFENYDNNYRISLIRSKIKVQNGDNTEEGNSDEEWIIGYSIIKIFNYTVFDYEERSISFFSDTLITLRPPKSIKKLTKNILYLLNCLLGFSCFCLVIIRLKIEMIPLEAKKK